MSRRPDLRVLEGLRAYFHQDWDVAFGGLDETVAAFVANLGPEELTQVNVLAERLSADHTPAELKGMLNRMCTDVALDTRSAQSVMTTIRLQTKRRLDDDKRG